MLAALVFQYFCLVVVGWLVAYVVFCSSLSGTFASVKCIIASVVCDVYCVQGWLKNSINRLVVVRDSLKRNAPHVNLIYLAFVAK